jgi:peptide/nickel transport system ATP-binding protein
VTALLDVRDLSVSFSTADGMVEAVRGVSFEVDAGRTLGIVGESGSGKSVATQTIVGLTQGARVSGQANFEGRDLLAMHREQLRQVRGAEIALIFQDPLSSLHPHFRVGWQIIEAIQAHRNVSRTEARQRTVELLGLVGIPDPAARIDDFPHQFSGGMRQRAMIAMALVLNPKLLIADEPTTALDVTVQAQIIELMKALQADLGTTIILITHDLGVLADIADDVCVMYAGQVMERGPRAVVYREPHHPYTAGLIEALPSRERGKARLRPIPGMPPSAIGPPAGCPFHPRCRYAFDRCRVERPPLVPVGGDDHRSACWLPADHERLVDTSVERIA